ncbi:MULTISPECIES: AbgT family transporter [Microbacterium]|uniref:AbgT family transporter n=2 Tax=Microbacterium TaxID=33882 RepID=A0ABY4J0V0_9MICO|nr:MULTISPECIES: AbgT family transporter [Microbacterium]MCK8466996.1 AbgT family transporter [Microbacterium aurugineum]MCK8476522.1 AbgT family transporter [Microbacterium aurugineum]TCJ28162.1 AbgT family transporter [Microbacterium sp. PI-1]UPL18634.1 AbgT family transporter [Microbacterium aurugineum]
MATEKSSSTPDAGDKGFLNWIEKVGNKVPDPTIMFVYLIGLIAVLSAVLAWIGVSVTDDVVIPVPKEEFSQVNEQFGGNWQIYDTTTGMPAEIPDYTIEERTFEVRNLLSIDGIRFFFSSFVDNFAGFGVVAVVLIAMAGVGVAEHAGLMGAMIRRVVKVAPRRWLAFILIFVGVLSSVATDAGYLILVPLAAAAFLTVGRHPLAGLAGAFAGVGAAFGANLLITPSDSMLTEITNEVLVSAGMQPIEVTQNFYFGIVSTFLLATVALLVTVFVTEKRLGSYDRRDMTIADEAEGVDHDAEARGLKFSFWALLGFVALVLALTLPPGAPLRDPETGAIIGTTPFMASLVFLISLAFLVCGVAYGAGARTLRGGTATVRAIAKTFASLGGLLVMFLMIAQFIALFNWTNLPTVAAVSAAELLEQASVPAIVLLLAFIVVIVILDFILPGLVPKWVIFAPVFIPIFASLDVAPQTLLAAYRVGDSPVNVLTPLMVYLPFMVTVAQRYKKEAGIGTIIALMIPYAVWMLLSWTALYVVWFLLGIPWGPGSPVDIAG